MKSDIDLPEVPYYLSYEVYFWSALLLTSTTIMVFVVGGTVRYRVLQDFGESSRTVFSRLFKTKQAMFCLLMLLDLSYLVLTITQEAWPDNAILYADKRSTIKRFFYSPEGLIVTAIVVEIVNFLVIASAAMLLYYEYVRCLSEAWYAHKLFIWTSFVCQFCHICVFFDLYSRLSSILTAVRCLIFIVIAIMQLFTRTKAEPRTLKDDDYMRDTYVNQEILRSFSTMYVFE